MADAPAMPSSSPASAVDASPSSRSVSAPRVLPSTILLDTRPPSSGRAPGPRGRGGRAAAASGSGGRGGGRGRKSALPAATSNGTRGTRPDRLVEVIGKMPTRVDAGLVSADILQLANAKGPMFEWLTYWPEEGFPDEDHPY